MPKRRLRLGTRPEPLAALFDTKNMDRRDRPRDRRQWPWRAVAESSSTMAHLATNQSLLAMFGHSAVSALYSVEQFYSS